MNKLTKYFNSENRNKTLNYLRPWAYFTHPELKIKSVPTKRWKMLMTMRDLRLWILENAPNSSRATKHEIELEHINKELHYLQFKGLAKSVLLFSAVCIWFSFWGPQHWRGTVSIYDRPT
jgi:hypothetical protein